MANITKPQVTDVDKSHYESGSFSPLRGPIKSFPHSFFSASPRPAAAFSSQAAPLTPYTTDSRSLIYEVTSSSVHQTKKMQYKNKSRTGSSTALPQSFSSNSSEAKYTSMRTQYDSITTLEDETKRLKREITEKNSQIQDLKRVIKELELQKVTSEMHSNSRLERMLDVKEEQVRALKEQVTEYEHNSGVLADQEVKRIASLYVTSESQLAEARTELDSLTSHIKELESKQHSSNLYDIIGRFQSENKVLKDEIRRLQSQVLSQANYSTLEREFQEVEQMQNKLISDNGRLKQEIEMQKDAWYQQQDSLTALSISLKEGRKDLSQLTEVIRIVRNGEGASAALILGHLSQPVKFGASDEIADVVIGEETKALRSDLSTLRQLLSDIYAEQSSHLCTQQ